MPSMHAMIIKRPAFSEEREWAPTTKEVILTGYLYLFVHFRLGLRHNVSDKVNLVDHLRIEEGHQVRLFQT